jgi:hypothetical protein
MRWTIRSLIPSALAPERNGCQPSLGPITAAAAIPGQSSASAANASARHKTSRVNPGIIPSHVGGPDPPPGRRVAEWRNRRRPSKHFIYRKGGRFSRE